MWFLWFEWLYKLNSLGKVDAKISWVVITIILLKFLITAKLVINSHKYLNWQIFDKNRVYLLLSWTKILWYKFHRDFYAHFAIIFDVLGSCVWQDTILVQNVACNHACNLAIACVKYERLWMNFEDELWIKEIWKWPWWIKFTTKAFSI